MDWQLYNDLLEQKCDNPHDFLGIRRCGRGQIITVYRPMAVHVSIIDKTNGDEYEMERVDDKGLFALS